MDQLIAALRRKAAITPSGKVISGYGYNDVKLGRHPNRHDLDEVSNTQPVVITHGSGHITTVNSYVLNAAGIAKDTRIFPGGSLDRDPDGAPNGVIRESARKLISDYLHKVEVEVPRDQELQGYLNCFRQDSEGHHQRWSGGWKPRFFPHHAGIAQCGKSCARWIYVL